MFDAATFIPSVHQRTREARARPLSSFYNVSWTNRGVPPQSLAARGQKLIGLKYERRVIDVMSAIYGADFRAAPMIQYQTSLRDAYVHRAIPDGILTLPYWTIIIEVKLAHTEVVWEQLMERYLPLVSRLTDAPLRPVEVCRSYDPAVPLPGSHTLIDSLHRPPARMGELEVIQWRI